MALIPVECSESKEAVVARSDHHCRTRVGQPADLRKTGARSTRQRSKLFAWDLQSGPGPTCLRSALKERAAWHSRERRGACLRHVFARSCGKAKISRGLSLSTGATRLLTRDRDSRVSSVSTVILMSRVTVRHMCRYKSIYLGVTATTRLASLLTH